MSISKLKHNGLPFSNVVATGTATAQVTPGSTVESIMLELGGTSFTKAMITILKVKANGKVILESTGTQLAAILAYRGYSANAAYLEIPFEDLTGISTLDKSVGCLDTSQGIQNITIEATITGATAPTLAMRLYEAAQQKSASGKAAPYAPVLTKLLRYPFSIGNGGRLPITLPFGTQNGAIIKRVHVMHGGNLTGMTVKQDAMVIFEGTKAQNEYEQARHGRVPQANVGVIDFVIDGSVADALDTRDARSMEWLMDFSAADNGFILVEYLDTLGNL